MENRKAGSHTSDNLRDLVIGLFHSPRPREEQPCQPAGDEEVGDSG